METDLMEALQRGYTVTITATSWGGYECKLAKQEDTGMLADKGHWFAGFDKTLAGAVKNAATVLTK